MIHLSNTNTLSQTIKKTSCNFCNEEFRVMGSTLQLSVQGVSVWIT